MTRFSKLIVLFFLLPSIVVLAQKQTSATRKTITRLKNHVSYLAADSLEGRRAGTSGEVLAQRYIVNQFEKIRLLPKGTNGFYQPFFFSAGKQINAATKLSFNNDELVVEKDFFPLAFSKNGAVVASPIILVQEVHSIWFLDLKSFLEENKSNPHLDTKEALIALIKKQIAGGASAIILFNSSEMDDGLQFDKKDRTPELDIPVLYVNKSIAKKYLSDPTATINVSLKVEVAESKKAAANIVGYIDNNAATTVVLGAHFDHLGYGEDGNSMLRTGEKLIHNGADDNASGTAALIELAKKIKQGKSTGNNYLLIAFSAEELGLLGSKYFTENPTIDLSKINYMVNLDMVGRMNDSTRAITLGGYGTSPQWGSVITAANKPFSFVIKPDSSGSGPSDHTSFYRKNIPVLFFFTGIHYDYHKPSDDFDKINYSGEAQLINFIYNIITTANNLDQRLSFAKTKETQVTSSARFRVSLGIMPDYSFGGTGVRCDGISEGRAAQKAGMLAGDVIIQINEHPITSVENYMQVLGKFKPGDRVDVKYIRGEAVLLVAVQF